MSDITIGTAGTATFTTKLTGDATWLAPRTTCAYHPTALTQQESNQALTFYHSPDLSGLIVQKPNDIYERLDVQAEINKLLGKD